MKNVYYRPRKLKEHQPGCTHTHTHTHIYICIHTHTPCAHCRKSNEISWGWGEENLTYRRTKEKNYIRHQKPCKEKEWDTIFQVLNIKCQQQQKNHQSSILNLINYLSKMKAR